MLRFMSLDLLVLAARLVVADLAWRSVSRYLSEYITKPLLHR